MTATLTRDIGVFLAQVSFGQLPARAVDLVRLGFTDCIAVMIAGRDEPAVRTAAQVLGENGSGASRLFMGPRRTSPERAALLNGIAAHVLDYDDVALSGHPSAVLVPAVLALAEDLDCDGKRMIAAYAAGYEVWAELIERLPDHLHNKGWHPTSVLGTVAAAAAGAVVLALDAGRAAHAVALSASMASGLIANFGSMTKSFQVGRAAQAGVQAARLAAAGFTAVGDAIEHPRGYLAALSPTAAFDADTPAKLGQDWRLERHGLNVKRYPVCYCAHRAIDAMLDTLQKRPVAPDAVASIDSHLGQTAFNILRNKGARTGLEAKFSIEFAMAAALHAGRVGLSELTNAFVQRPDIQATMAKVNRCVLPDDPENDLPFARADRVRLRLTDGTVLDSRDVAHARGSNAAPLTREELSAKFHDCVRDRPPAAVEALFDDLQRLETIAGACRWLGEGDGAGRAASSVMTMPSPAETLRDGVRQHGERRR